MSGIYIKNAKLPPKGSHAICLLTWDGAFWKLGYKDENWVEEEDMYIGEAIPVPDHGRLIDAHELQAGMMEIVESGLYGLEDMIDEVIEAPTVIPADRGAGK